MTIHLERLIENLHSHIYPQDLVAEVLMTPVTDLNAWRKRDLIFVDTWTRKGRVFYSGHAVLMACAINELAPLLGPTKASGVGNVLAQLMERFGEPIYADFDAELSRVKKDEALNHFLNEVAAFGAPVGSYERATIVRNQNQEGIMDRSNKYNQWPWVIMQNTAVKPTEMNQLVSIWPHGRRFLDVANRLADMGAYEEH